MNTPVSTLYRETVFFQSIIKKLEKEEPRNKEQINLLRKQIIEFEQAIKTLAPNFYTDMEENSNLKPFCYRNDICKIKLKNGRCRKNCKHYKVEISEVINILKTK